MGTAAVHAHHRFFGPGRRSEPPFRPAATWKDLVRPQAALDLGGAAYGADASGKISGSYGTIVE